MSLQEYCKTDVVTVSPDETIIEAAKIMKDRHVGDVVVVREQGKNKLPIGVLTDRDITVGCVANMADRIADLSVEEVMSKDLVTISDDMGIYDVAQKMREAGVARLPVVNKDGALVGIISAKNILALINDELTEIVEISDSHKEAGQQSQAKGGKGATAKPATPPLQ